MSNSDSHLNGDLYAKQTSTFVLPTKRNKKPCINKSTSYISTSTNNIDNRTPIFVDLEGPLTNTAKQLCDIKSLLGNRKIFDLRNHNEVIDMTNMEHNSLGTLKNTPTLCTDFLMNDDDEDGNTNTHIIDLTDSIQHNLLTTVPRRPSLEQASSTTLTDVYTTSTSPNLVSSKKLKERGAAIPRAPPQLNVTPNAADESSKADHQKRETPAKRKAITYADHQLRLRSISTLCDATPDYESLTLVELRNAVKKYGYKPKDRQSMIDTLNNIQSVLNTTDSPTLDSQPHSISAPFVSSSQVSPPTRSDNLITETSRKQEFASRIKGDLKLWEQVLRYESVDIKMCSKGLSPKERNAYHEYLDENALVHKPSRNRSQSRSRTRSRKKK